MMEYYLAFKKKEILQDMTTWMDLEDISWQVKEARLLKDKYCIILLNSVSKIVKFIKSKTTMGVTRGWGREEWEVINQMAWSFS